MSGGSMQYLYTSVEYARFDTHTTERRAFKKHLELVAKALHDIEWVDSGDYSEGDENDSIRACLSDTKLLESAIEHAKEALEELRAELKRAKEK